MPKKLKTETKTEPVVKAPEPVVPVLEKTEPVKKVRKPRVKKVEVASDGPKGKGKSKSPKKELLPETGQKTKKAPSRFAIFMKANYEKVKHLPNKERLAELAKMYKQSNSQ